MTARQVVGWVIGWVAAAVLVSAVVYMALGNPAIVIGGLLAVGLIVATAMRPMVGVVAWLAVLVLIPDWTVLPVGLKPISVIGIVVLVGLLVSRRRERIKIAWPDFTLLSAVLVLTALTYLESYPLVLLSNLAGALGVSYWLGRTVPATARRAYLYAMVVVSIWGILEALTSVHLYSEWMLSPTHHWEEVQTRSGVDRSEAAFGHAIAYGAAIAMAIPFARELPRHAGLFQVILLAGVFASFSRGPILTATLTLGLAVVFASTGRRRIGSILLLILALGVTYFVFQFLYGGEDAATTELSGDQRTIQLLATLPNVQWFGSSGLSFEDGRVQTLGADIIDNTFLRLAINFGWILAVLILAPLVFAVTRFFQGQATPSSLALIGQIPVLLVTTLITQWQAAVFLIAGMAVTELVALRAAQKTATRSDPGLVRSDA